MTEEVKETRIIERNWLPLAIVVAAIILAFALWSWGTATANSASNNTSYTEEELASAVEKAVAKAVAEVYVTTACGCETTFREDARKDTLLDTLPIAEIGDKKGAYGLLEGYTSVGNVYDANEKIVGPAIFKPHSFSLQEETKDNGIYVAIGQTVSIEEGSVVWRLWGDCDDIIIKGESPWWNKLFRYQE